MTEWNKDMAAAPIGVDLLVRLEHSLGADEWTSVHWVDFRGPEGDWVMWVDMIWVPFAPTAWMHIPE